VTPETGLLFPLDLQSIVSFAPLNGDITVYIQHSNAETHEKRTRISVFDAHGRLCLLLEGLHATPLQNCRAIEVAGDFSV
jgi:hypothetical protein